MNFDPNHPLLVSCKRLGAAFDARDAEIVERMGISRNELRLLNFLEQGPRSQVDIAHHLQVSRAAITAMTDNLTSAGFVNRSPSQDDRRVNLVSLTPRLWGALAEHYGPGGQRVLSLVDGLSQGEVVELVERLDQISAAIEPVVT